MKKIRGMMYPPKGKHPNVVSCHRCGKKLLPRDAYYHVDGNNCAITNNAPPYCKDCAQYIVN